MLPQNLPHAGSAVLPHKALPPFDFAARHPPAAAAGVAAAAAASAFTIAVVVGDGGWDNIDGGAHRGNAAEAIFICFYTCATVHLRLDQVVA